MVLKHIRTFFTVLPLVSVTWLDPGQGVRPCSKKCTNSGGMMMCCGGRAETWTLAWVVNRARARSRNIGSFMLRLWSTLNFCGAQWAQNCKKWILLINTEMTKKWNYHSHSNVMQFNIIVCQLLFFFITILNITEHISKISLLLFYLFNKTHLLKVLSTKESKYFNLN